MQSFRTELENPIVEKDILDLEKKINAFKNGQLNEEKFRSLRLARGVYGQRQPGVQMIRIKIPYGKLTTDQLLRIADVSDEYSRGRLHTTTRQDIQIHYVSLDRTPELWAELEKSKVTLREACGNTVRNVTASPLSGIEPNEAFDVSPHAQATFEYFLRQPFGQELGRKFKIAFSNSEKDSGLTYINDLGFIAKKRITEIGEERGFKVTLAGGLGAQAFEPKELFDFLPEDQVIPLIEATLRIFDRYGERNKRHKARIKYLIKDIGVEKFVDLIQTEKSLKHQSYPIDTNTHEPIIFNTQPETPKVKDLRAFNDWKSSNVIPQKQNGYFAVAIKLLVGDFYTDQARKLVEIVRNVAADDIRITPSQNLILKYVKEENLPYLYNELEKINLNTNGYDSTFDITACPGTDTCNLGISNSTSTATIIEKYLREEFSELLTNEEIKIKISGCMNACGQHTIANIGFHGSSIKTGDKVLPALQVLLGGDVNQLADKVIKIPSKRVLEAIHIILSEYKKSAKESFNEFYWDLGKKHFYSLLKHLNDKDKISEEDFIDWGQEAQYERAVGIGECAGVVIDLVGTLFLEAEEKLDWANDNLEKGYYADAAYHAYSAIVCGAKALLTSKGLENNSHISIINNFEEEFIQKGIIDFDGSFNDFVLQIRNTEATETFTNIYLKSAKDFIEKVQNHHLAKQ